MEPLVKAWWYSLPREKTFPFSRPDRWEEIPEDSKEMIFGNWMDHLRDVVFSKLKEEYVMDIKESAEKHWGYTNGIIERCLEWKQEGEIPVYREMNTEEWVELCHYLYIQAFTHGVKHGVDEK